MLYYFLLLFRIPRPVNPAAAHMQHPQQGPSRGHRGGYSTAPRPRSNAGVYGYPYLPVTQYAAPAQNNQRYKIWILLFTLISNSQAKEITHSLFGYNCDQPTDHVMYPSPCLKVSNRDSNKVYSAWVTYQASNRMVLGLRCITEVSLQSYYCGTSSHIHLLDTPMIEKIALTPTECNQVYKSRSINMYNRLYSVEPNTGMNHHGIMINGSLKYGKTLGVNNVFCNPDGIQTGNHFFDYGFQTGMLSISVTQVPLLLTKESIIDIQQDTVIGHWKNCTRGCTASTGSYYIPGDHTRYRLVKHLYFHKYMTGNQIFIINKTENIHMEIYKITYTRINNRMEQVFETELPDLVLLTNSDLEGKIPYLHNRESRYDISSYMNTLYKFKQLQDEIDQQLQYEVCVKTHRIRILPSTHYTRGKAITTLGELIRISTCPQVPVIITEGRQDNCYTNHITVQVNNITKIMLPGSRVLFNIDNIQPVDCKDHPIYLYIGNNTYVGNNGSGMNSIQIEQEINHQKTHIFWSPLDEAFKSLSVKGEQSIYTSKVTYLNDLTGTESILQTTSEQVTGLEEVFNWTFGQTFTGRFKKYFWSVVCLIIVIALISSFSCFVIKCLCHKIYHYKFLPNSSTTDDEYELQ